MIPRYGLLLQHLDAFVSICLQQKMRGDCKPDMIGFPQTEMRPIPIFVCLRETNLRSREHLEKKVLLGTWQGFSHVLQHLMSLWKFSV